MTKPTQFFLGLVSNIFSSPRIASPVDVEGVLKEKAQENGGSEVCIPDTTPTLEGSSSRPRAMSFAFRYGAQ